MSYIINDNGIERHATIDEIKVIENDIKNSKNKKFVVIREQRNEKLTACDWRMLTDNLGSAEWKVYRQALRDVPQQAGFPDNVVWPDAP